MLSLFLFFVFFCRFLLFFFLLLAFVPAQVVDNKINKFRHVILEILHRLPNNEVLKPYVQELLLLVMCVVDSDNEDNAIQGLRVVFDLQKNYRPQLESEVPRFLQVLFSKFRNTVECPIEEPLGTGQCCRSCVRTARITV